MPKVLIPLYKGQHVGNASATTCIGHVERVWKGLGYETEIITVDPDDPMLTSTTPGSGIGDPADILCFPYMNSDLTIGSTTEYGFASKRGSAQIPTFVVYFNDTPTVNYFIGGVQDRVSPTIGYETAYWGTDQIFTTYTRKYSDWEDTGAAGGLVTPLVADNWPPERGVDGIFAWKWESDQSANNSPTYYCAGNQDTVMLMCLIQEAVDRGDIPAPPKRKTVFFDFDDFPMSLVTSAEVDRVATKMQQYGLKGTCGIHGSFDPVSNAGEAQILNYLDTFTLIDHQTAGNTYFFDWDQNLGETKLDMDTKHRANVAAMQALGTKMRVDSGGYRMFNQNAINNNGLALLSPDVSIANDPNETAAQAGYGLNIIRMSEPTSSRGNGNLTISRFSRFNSPQQGVEIALYKTVSSESANQAVLDDAAFNVAVLSNWRALLHSSFAPKYLSITTHNVDHYDGHDGGTAGSPGATQWERSIDFIMKCSAIFRPVDPRTIQRIPTSFLR